MEVWKDVVGFEDLFSISSLGRFYSKRSNKILKTHINKLGYEGLATKVNYQNKYFRIHRVVAEAFLPNLEDLPEVNHKDGCPSNNEVSNLEWCDRSTNLQHSYDLLGRQNPKGFENPCFSLDKESVDFILNNYKPRCREFGSRALGRLFKVDHTTILKIIKDNRR